MTQNENKSARSRGFSLVEVIIAMAILMFGLLALLAMFGTAISATQHAQEDLIAKQKAREALESVYSARDDAAITFAQIQNTPGGIYKTGFQQMLRIDPGSTQVLGTVAPPLGPGEGATPDYVLAPDTNSASATYGQLVVQVPLTNYQRQVQIDPVIYTTGPNIGAVNPNLRKITVTVRVIGTPNRDYTVTGYISSFR